MIPKISLLKVIKLHDIIFPRVTKNKLVRFDIDK